MNQFRQIAEIKNIKGNEEMLLATRGYESIYDAKKQLGINAPKIYAELFNEYNKSVKIVNENIRKQRAEQKFKEELEKIKKEIKIKESTKKEKKNIEKSIKDFSKGKSKEINLNLKNIYSKTSMNNEDVLKSIIKSVKKNLFGKPILITAGAVSYTLNDTTIHRLEQSLNRNYVDYEEEYGEPSDARIKASINNGSSLSISGVISNHSYNKANGAFFPYTHNTIFDLSRYGLYTQIEEEENTCLLQAFLNGGLDASIVEEMKCYVKNRRIPKSDFEAICNIGKIRINLKNIDDVKSRNNSRNVYGKNFTNEFNIGLIEEHYFIIEQTNITSFCIENYDDIKKEKDCNLIYKKQDKYYKRDIKRCLDSFDLIKCIVNNKNKLLKKISCEDNAILATQFYNNTINDDIIDLNYNVKECVRANFDEKNENGETKKMIIIKKKKSMIETGKASEFSNEDKQKLKEFFLPTLNIFADFETDPNDIHIPYLFCLEYEIKGEVFKKNFWGIDCGKNGLDYLFYEFNKKYNITLIFHNAKYDYRFIIQYGFKINELSNGGIFISASFIYKGLKVNVKDSYKMITMGLNKFSKTFNLGKFEKEVMPYKYYNQEIIKKTYGSIKDALDYLDNEEEKNKFLENINKWNLKRGNDFNHRIYAIKYCERDCEILRKGYNIFRSWILEYFLIDINDVLTISSLAYRIFVEKGCYDETYSLGGKVQNFINRCVVGGRTMCKNNKKDLIIDINYADYEKGFDEFLNDLDAVSLYPSAYMRMKGFLKGIPKVIENKDYNFLKNKDGLFVKIKILEVGIKRDFPLMSYKNEEGVRIFSNDMIGKEIYVDKISLEDLIEFQDVKFEIIKGYYYDEGHNEKSLEVMRYIFYKRVELKKVKNPAELVFKLIMNSAYGKNIQKPHDEKVEIFDDEESYKKYLSRNYNWIKEVIKFGDKYKVKSFEKIKDQYNNCHIGCEILSMSKRIMNEVMTTAEDNGIKIHYQDTDSTHLKNKDIFKLEKIYKEKYGRNLIGKDMGQFHSDFSIEKDNKNYDKNVFARRSIFLGKKAYIDELIVKDENENIIIDYHIRLKGIPNSCVDYTYKKLGYANPFDLYLDLYNGKKIDFDLLEGNGKHKFKFNKDYTITSLKNIDEENMGFSRSVQFTDIKSKKKPIKK